MLKGLLNSFLLLALWNITSYANENHISEYSYSQSLNLLDTTKPVIIHTSVYYCPKYAWPKEITGYMSDSSGIDSVWVKWYKNFPGNMSRQFKLNHGMGDYYWAYFNSNYNEVNYWDIIYYRIFAQDGSSNHNKDSTQLYAITISDGAFCQFGNGIDSSKYPFTTYWMDGRTQMLFTKQEINSCGINVGGILSVSFRVLSFSPQVMNGFTVRFQHTTQTSLTYWVTSGWTTAYTGEYSIQDTGWQAITMQSPPFWYNGSSNLLMEICYDNSSYTQYSYVYSTPIPGMTWGYYADNQTGCYMTSGSSQSRRPNVRFSFQTWFGINGNKNHIPEKFNLSQNYPNPFNPVTRIDFDIPKKGFVSLRVYDLLGREVQSLVNEEKQAGSYTIDFEATDLTSGVYFYRLEADGFSNVKKMILIK